MPTLGDLVQAWLAQQGTPGNIYGLTRNPIISPPAIGNSPNQVGAGVVPPSVTPPLPPGGAPKPTMPPGSSGGSEGAAAGKGTSPEGYGRLGPNMEAGLRVAGTLGPMAGLPGLAIASPIGFLSSMIPGYTPDYTMAQLTPQDVQNIQDYSGVIAARDAVESQRQQDITGFEAGYTNKTPAPGIPGFLGVLQDAPPAEPTPLGPASEMGPIGDPFGVDPATQMSRQEQQDLSPIGGKDQDSEPGPPDISGYGDYGPGGFSSTDPGAMGNGIDSGGGQQGSQGSGMDSSASGADGGYWRKGGVANAKRPTRAVFGEAGPETGIFIPAAMKRPGIQGRERSVRQALGQFHRELKDEKSKKAKKPETKHPKGGR